MEIKELALKYKDYVINLRRYFHQYPEASMQEYKTSVKIKEELDKMGIPYIAAANTGVVATILGKAEGKVIALRADMDALEINENSDIEYRSRNNGFMHACGHDGHIAALLGAAKVLKDLQSEFNGTVKLIFQPAEEVGRGARTMVAEDVLKGVDGVFGIHVSTDLEYGRVSVEPGPRMAAADSFRITVTGKSGHGARPNQAVDAVVAASAIVLNLQSLVSRELDPLEPAVVSIGTFHSGTRFNIVSNKAVLEGTTRCFSNEVRKQFPDSIKRIIKLTAESYRAQAELEYWYAAAPVINDPSYSQIAAQSVEKILSKEALAVVEKSLGAEDFSEYMEKAPGVFAFVGARNESKGASFPHHHEKFNIDEDSLQIASGLYAQYAIDFLNHWE